MIERYEKFSSIISEIQKKLHKLATDEMKKFGLRGSWAKYLIAMKIHNEGVTAGQLCTICDRNKADVSRAMAELEAEGLVMRADGDTSYRIVFVLTDRGSDIASALAKRAKYAIDYVSAMTEEERAFFYGALETISNNLEVLTESGIPDAD